MIGLQKTKTLESGFNVEYWEVSNFFTDLENQLLIVEMSGFISKAKRDQSGVSSRADIKRIIIDGKSFQNLAAELNETSNPRRPVLEIIKSYILLTEEFTGATEVGRS